MCEAKICFTASSSAGLVETRKTDLPDVPSFGLTTIPRGFSFNKLSMASHDPRAPTYSLKSGPRNSACGTQATPDIFSTSAVADLSFAILCATALLSPTSYPNAKRRLAPRCMTISQPSARTSTAMARFAQYCLTASTNIRWLLSIVNPSALVRLA